MVVCTDTLYLLMYSDVWYLYFFPEMYYTSINLSVKLGRSHWVWNLGWGCLRIGCWGEYLGPKRDEVGVAYWLRRCATSRTVPGSIPGGVTGEFFPWYPRQNHVPGGRLSLWKCVPGIFPGVKAAGAFSWRPTTLVVPKRQENPGL